MSIANILLNLVTGEIYLSKEKRSRRKKRINILIVGLIISLIILFSGLIISGLDIVEIQIGNTTEQNYGFYYYLASQSIPDIILFKYIVGITSSIFLSSVIFLSFLMKYESEKNIRKMSVVILNLFRQGMIKTVVETKPSATVATVPREKTVKERESQLKPVSSEKSIVPSVEKHITRGPETSPRRPIAPLKRCPYCGGVLPLGDVHVFCPHCGKRLK